MVTGDAAFDNIRRWYDSPPSRLGPLQPSGYCSDSYLKRCPHVANVLGHPLGREIERPLGCAPASQGRGLLRGIRG